MNPERRSIESVSKASLLTYPYDYMHDLYQEAFGAALDAALRAANGRLELRPSGPEAALRLLRRLRYSTKLQRMQRVHDFISSRVLDVLARGLGGELDPSEASLGRYQLQLNDGQKTKFAIDSADFGDPVVPPDSIDGTYFKTNYWAGKDYPANVAPLFNANPQTYRNLAYLRSLRNTSHEFDFSFIVRVWGGADEVEGVEHCVRLLEAASRSPRKKYLLAYVVAGDIPATIRRLEKAGVRCVTQMIPSRELWSVTAASRVSIIRLGMHYCIPWRFFDLLAMGAMPLLDQRPMTVWPQPLEMDTHYGAAAIATGHDRHVATLAEYQRLNDALERYLSDDSLIQFIRKSTASYFDTFLAPIPAGLHILSAALQTATPSRAEAALRTNQVGSTIDHGG